MNAIVKWCVVMITVAIVISDLCDAKELARAKRHRRVTNGNSHSYDKRTHGSSLGYRADQIVSTSAYRDTVRASVACTGRYCATGRRWACDRASWSNCYNVEHIIDAGGAELRAYPQCKNVAANLVMAHSGWNQQLGAIARVNYELSASEKEAVYGALMMELARAAIHACQARARAKRAVVDAAHVVDEDIHSIRYARDATDRPEVAADHETRDIDEDISFNVTQGMIVADEDGVWLIPDGANITCHDCNETWCYGECDCPQCAYLEYTDQTAAAIAIIVTFVVAIFAIGGAAGAGIAYSIARTCAGHRARKFNEMDERATGRDETVISTSTASM